MKNRIPNTPITRYDLFCPDEELRKLLSTIVCCTNCDFNFDLDDEENDLIIKNKEIEYRVDISKYLTDVRVVEFKIEDKKLILKQSNDDNFTIPLKDLLGQIFYKGSFITSSPGIITDFRVPHGLNFKPMFYNIENETKDSQGYTHVTVTTSHFIVHYEIAPKVGLNNIKYNWTVTI
jgi:hypothetical protein